MPTPHEILKQFWGYGQFRALQEDIIQSVLDGKDTLALLPTGGGKSICFQVPALCMPGVCVVISPLIALMKDQVSNLKKRNIQAEAIYSGMASRDIDRILDNAVYGGLKFLYLSPERLLTQIVQIRLQNMNVCLLAIDEAHCISQWGYDFRPPYLQIAAIRDLLTQKIPILALTATATPDVVIDIQEKLAFKQPNVFQKSFERSNLAYVVVESEDKVAKAIDIIKKVPGTGVIYVRNRKKTKDIAYSLSQQGIIADFYHAGLTGDERSRKQEDWINNKIRIIVSTNAFGMGIDKPDVRSVIHIDPPDNIEAYFQEAGRGGRDEQKAYAVLLYSKGDKSSLEHGFTVAFPELKEVRQVYRALGSYFQLGVGGGEGESYDFDIIEFSKTYRFEDQIRVLSCLKILEQAGWITLSESIFVPSSIFMKYKRDELYDFQLRNRDLDLIIKALTRAYPAMYAQPIFISEKALAHFMKISEEETVKKLQYLNREQVIEYISMKDKPQLTFLRERVNAEDLVFDHKLYQFRKERQRHRIDKMIAYCEAARCRSVMLMEYFGQANAKPCRTCDYCLANPDKNKIDEDFERHKEKIIYMLRREPLSSEQIVNSFSSHRQKRVFDVLTYLLDEAILIKSNEKIKINTNI